MHDIFRIRNVVCSMKRATETLGCYFIVLVISQRTALDDNVVPHEIRSLTSIRKKEI